jgi:AcrR family transcriptional regulator
VLEKAMPVFWKHGFADTSLQELERATGVNKSGLYTEFRDKGNLFVREISSMTASDAARYGIRIYLGKRLGITERISHTERHHPLDIPRGEPLR